MCGCFQLYCCKVPFLFFFLMCLYLAKEYCKESPFYNCCICSAIASNFQNLLLCATFYYILIHILFILYITCHYSIIASVFLCSYLKTFCIIVDLFPYGICIYSFVVQYILQFILLHFIYLYVPLFYSFHLSVYFDFVISVPIIHNATPTTSTC